ncbi:MAG: 2-amino-4-hydroxy-6-hydroxymethyldihydropteridine diphosphokinase [Frankiales bacterium]|jgi:2-amino-4-hydroxy-6-hydroxymethyldihydropteridine diphosphokinase|nr:2-amino-4-hydroxy-6-hydroxymethyldihydropteridine diphosphokinase [Frankiales bacterium]
MARLRPAVLSLGSNQGDRLGFLQLAVDVLQPHAISSVWQTAPWGGVEQDDFLNAVVLCAFDATAAWERAQEAEVRAGRVRDVRWGPRTLDVDVVLADPPVPAGLLLPHPRAQERAFVLAPWLELDPAARLPQGAVADLLAALPEDVTRRPDLVLR